MNFYPGKSFLLAKAILLLSLSHFLQTTDAATVNCAPKFQIYANHTACLNGSTASVVSAADRQSILNQHNGYRSNASPPASDILMLKWSNELAMLAQKWADNCVFQHDANERRNIPGGMTVGQNLAAGFANWTAAVKAWHDEYKMFTYGSSTNNFAATGHYTAIMWSNTTLTGCGYKLCAFGRFFVCNYAPSGNVYGMINTPYKQGTPCTSCPGRCVNSKLCDCNRTCLNGGVLNKTSCACTCVVNSSLYGSPDCYLNCTKTVDPSWCPSLGKCPGQAIYCPHKCGLCFRAGKGYPGN